MKGSASATLSQRSEARPAVPPPEAVQGSPTGTARNNGSPEQKAAGSPLLLASVGTYSGPIGAVLSPMLHGARVWVKRANERGGLNGHPIKLSVYDDGTDPARHRAQVQDAIDNRHVVAFLQNSEGVTGGPSVSYIESKGVPVIGLSSAEAWSNTSPMYFPQTSSGPAQFETWPPAYSRYWIPLGLKKLGVIVCSEAQACSDVDSVFVRDAPNYGFDYVYRGKASVAQPDYTAECLAARNAGAQAIFIALDQNSIGRLAASCARQGYRPAYGTAALTVVDRLKDDPNLDGLAAPSATFPYFQSGTPATDEFQQAMKENGVAVGGGVALGWTAGKLLEAAARHVPISEPPSSATILAGLWAINRDTLGGLTGPLTFAKDKPAPPVRCWYMTAVKEGTWVSPDNYQLHCRDRG